MERNVQKNGLVNLVAAVVIFIAAFVVTCYVNSLAARGCSIFLGLGALVAFASWFQMRLEENETNPISGSSVRTMKESGCPRGSGCFS